MCGRAGRSQRRSRRATKTAQIACLAGSPSSREPAAKGYGPLSIVCARYASVAIEQGDAAKYRILPSGLELRGRLEGTADVAMTMHARERILVVDDEPQMLVALQDLLDDDFEVVQTDSAER